jgi:hypothetical protein
MSLRDLIGTGLQLVGTYFGNPYLILAGTALKADDQRRQARRFRREQIRRLNDSLQDRLEMVDLQADAPRTLVLGRVRAVEGVRRRWVSGANSEKLTMIVSFAGHEIDAFEGWYLDDQPVSLDGSGWVTTSRWRKASTDSTVATGTLSGSGTASVALPSNYVSGSAAAVQVLLAGTDGETAVPVTVGVTGLTASISGGTADLPYRLTYSTDTSGALVRIRAYTGTASQNVGFDMAAEYPGKIALTDRFAGIACAVVDVLYDPDIFPQGRPNVTALMRGARCYDPRLDGTQAGGSGSHRIADPATWAWSDNSALCTLRYALWPHGLDLAAADLRISDWQAAANTCDISTDFTLRPAGGSPTVVTLPRYRCHHAIRSDAEPATVLDDLLETMAGRQGWAGGVWRVRAGALATPVATLDEGWVMQVVDESGQPGNEPWVRLAAGTARESACNRVAGKCIDSAQRYQLLPFPSVSDPVLIAAQGEYLREVEYPGVSHIAHAQHLASIEIRQAQASLTGQWTCGLQAYKLELFDVLDVDLPRLMTGVTHEVTGWQWSLEGGVMLQTAEVSAAIWTPLSELVGRDPAPNGSIRDPSVVPTLAGLAVVSGTSGLLDASVVSRVLVTWTAATVASIRISGRVEVQYWPIDEALPTGDWLIWEEHGSGSRAVIPGLRGGRAYLFRARFVQLSPFVRGPWSAAVLHVVAVRRGPKTFRQAGAPADADVLDGDEWIDSDDGERRYLRVSGVWQDTRPGTGGIAPGATSATTVLEVTAVTVTGAEGVPNTNYATTSRWTYLGEVAFTAEMTGQAAFFAAVGVSYSGAGGIVPGQLFCQLRLAVDWDGDATFEAGEELVEDYAQVPQPGTDVVRRASLAALRDRSIVSGVSYTWRIYAQKLEGVLTVDRLTVRVQQLKR